MIEIVPYSADLREDFYKINEEWITDMFAMEKLDEKILREPEAMILNDGGRIWFAKDANLGVIGTCALRKTGPNQFELTKMGVFKKARGLKAGEILLQHVLDHVRQNNLECFLLTNSKCAAAIHLYEKNGFVHDAEIKKQFGREYERCNVAMSLVYR